MKIENNGINPLTPQQTESARSVEKKSQAGESNSVSVPKDKATLSERGKALAKARAALDETSEIRENRVSELRDRIDLGTYEINFQSLAAKILKRLGLK